ncbi:type VI secretion system tube protein Hcp [Cytobacillus sp. FJAT-54145]|uniref:Type VI secretion system tube protein Hcp n=1 Tax=Cytobacillus spartinae TaxID=3299023 RepID=A0ABW6K9K3_9BACI
MGIIYPTTTFSVVIDRGGVDPDISFEISSYRINFSNTTTGGGGFDVEAGDLFVQKELDIASIPLFEAVTEGIFFQTLTLTVTQDAITLLTIILEDVSVTGFDQTGSGDGVSEEVRFHYEVITMETDAFGLNQSDTFDRNA